MITTGAQIRAARAMLEFRREDLARAASLHPNAVQYWEKREVPAGPQPYAVERILAGLKAKGIETFSDPSPGVRLVA